MMSHRLLPSLTCIAILSACAGPGPAVAPKPAPSVASAVAEADAALAAGQNDKALAVLEAAGAAFPADKMPWLRTAQIRFDSQNYGEAIVGGLEALQRDPDDALAHSIVALSAVRVSGKVLAGMARNSQLIGNVRTEAQALANQLRASLADEPGPVSRHAARAPAKVRDKAAAPAKARTAAADPFDSLR